MEHYKIDIELPGIDMRKVVGLTVETVVAMPFLHFFLGI